jgi:phospholipid/cholesterol/gamma-HCH transport system substrate-binding protein
MRGHAPRPGQLALMLAFALSCFAALLYMWISFGGTSPLQAQGYRFHVHFPEATQLAQQADVRIAGVPVGTVAEIEPGPGNSTDATIEMRARYAPVPRDTRAILRTKSLLGETYVELTQGTDSSGMLQEDAVLPRAAVAPTVELDEIFRSFDKDTRAAFRQWIQSQAAAADGRGPDLNAALAILPDFVSGSEELLAELHAQSRATSRLISSTGEVFDALSERDGQLRGLITDTNGLFGVTAQRNRELAAIFEELPRFERESTLTLPRLTEFADVALPVVRRLQPAATEMGPAFDALQRIAPDLHGLFERLGPTIDASERGVPAIERVLREVAPLLGDTDPFLRNLNPMLRHINLNRRELTSLLANVTATTNARDFNLEADGKLIEQPVNYLRAAALLAPEALTFYPRPLGYSRANAYAAPGWHDRLASGLTVYDTGGCANGDVAPPATADPPQLQPLVAANVFRTPGRDVARPPCIAQGPYPGFGTSFPQLRAEP